MGALASELRRRLEKVQQEERRVKAGGVEIEKATVEIEALMQEKRAKLRLEDVMASHSKRTLDAAFQRVSRELAVAIRKLEQEEDVFDKKLKLLTDKDRQAEVKRYYAEQVNSISNLLQVPAEERVGKPEPGARAEAGGSSAPRSMLAVHLALLRTNVLFGDSPRFPFVVDTPQQSGQDPENLRLMIESLQRVAGDGHQIVLATESFPPQTTLSTFEVVNFDTKRGALLEGQFEEALAFVREPYRKMNEALSKVRPEGDTQVAPVN